MPEPKTIEVKKKKGGGKAIINETDFDPKLHTKVDDVSPEDLQDRFEDEQSKLDAEKQKELKKQNEQQLKDEASGKTPPAGETPKDVQNAQTKIADRKK